MCGDATAVQLLEFLVILAREIPRLELQLHLRPPEADAFAGDEVEAQAWLLDQVRLAGRAAIGHAAAGIGQHQRLLRQAILVLEADLAVGEMPRLDRKSTRLNSSH